MGGFKAANDYVYMHTNIPNMTSLISLDAGHANCLDIQNDALFCRVFMLRHVGYADNIQCLGAFIEHVCRTFTISI